MKLKTIGLASILAITTSFAVMAATHQAVSGSSIWGETYDEAYDAAYANIKAKYPGVHEVKVRCVDMTPWYKCYASGVIDV